MRGPLEFQGTPNPAPPPTAPEGADQCEYLSCIDPRKVYPCLLDNDDER